MDRNAGTAADSAGVVSAYRRFRAADESMRERVRESTQMGENELRIIQFLVEAEDAGRAVKPSDLTKHLGVSSASTTALMDRLERAGSLERVAHPTDRRSILISATTRGREKVSGTLGAFEGRLHELSANLPEQARHSITEFLDSLAEAANAVATPAR